MQLAFVVSILLHTEHTPSARCTTCSAAVAEQPLLTKTFAYVSPLNRSPNCRLISSHRRCISLDSNIELYQSSMTVSRLATGTPNIRRHCCRPKSSRVSVFAVPRIPHKNGIGHTFPLRLLTYLCYIICLDVYFSIQFLLFVHSYHH